MKRHREMTWEVPERFPTTDWTNILKVRSEDETCRHAALEKLLGRYWRPIYCYLRCHGHCPEAAKDLTQDFFFEVVLKRGLIRQANRARGRFRTFVLASLNRYVVSAQRVETAKRRMPDRGVIRLEGMDRPNLPEPCHYASPAEIFDYAWASSLLDQVIGDVSAKCRETGNTTHWEVFRAKVLLPIMAGVQSPSLKSLCSKHGVSSEVKASNMIVTVKRCFKAMLRRHVRQLVSSDADVDGEIRELMRIFCGGSAGSAEKMRIY